MVRPDERFYEALGEDIRKIRKGKKIGLRRMSELTGYALGTLSRYENGDPNIEDGLNSICKVLGIDPDEEWEDIARQLAEEQSMQEEAEREEREEKGSLYIGDLTSEHQSAAKDYVSYLRHMEGK